MIVSQYGVQAVNTHKLAFLRILKQSKDDALYSNEQAILHIDKLRQIEKTPLLCKEAYHA